MASKRTLQLGEAIRTKIASMIVRGEVSDPGIKNVTIQRVVVTPDLQIAKVYYSVLGGDKQKSAAGECFKRSAGFFRSSIGEELGIRYTPKLNFFLDDSIEYAAHMGGILLKVREELEQSQTDELVKQESES